MKKIGGATMICTVKTQSGSTGTLQLGKVSFIDQPILISIDIRSVSKAIQEEIEKAIEAAKTSYIKEKYELYSKIKRTYNHSWSTEPVTINFVYLDVSLHYGKPISYSINLGFTDANDKYMEQWDCSIPVDLSTYGKEIKMEVIDTFQKMYFGK